MEGETTKINYLAIVAAVLAFAALVLPWFAVTMTAPYTEPPTNMEYTVYLYQVAGTVNGTSLTTTANVWFVWGALALVLVAAICSLAGSVFATKKGQLLILAAGIMALLSMVVFGAGLLNSQYVDVNTEPQAVLSLFPAGAFGLSAAVIEDYYHFSWTLSFGFWLALVSAILCFASLVTHSLERKKIQPPN